MAPIGVSEHRSKPKATLIGGFSMEDLRRAQERYEKEAPDPSRGRSSTLQGLSEPIKAVPSAQIFRKRRRSRAEPDAQSEEGSQDEPSGAPGEPEISHEAPRQQEASTARPTMQLDAGSVAKMTQEDSARAASTSPRDTIQIAPDMLHRADPEGDPLEHTLQGGPHVEAPLEPGRPPSPAADVGEVDEANRSKGTHEIDALPEADAPPELGPKGQVLDGDEYATMMLHAVDAGQHAAIEPPPEPSQPDAAPELASPAEGAAEDEHATERAGAPTVEGEGLAPLDAAQREALEALDERGRDAAFEAARALMPHPEVLARLEELFPGRLHVDRYQWTPETLPAPARHGPVMAAVLHLGQACVPMLERLSGGSILDVRFYATFALTELDATSTLGAMRERLFDRDAQTRAMAQRVLLAHRYAPNFEEQVLAPLRALLSEAPDESHVEHAAEVLGRARDRESMEVLIDQLDLHRSRIKEAIHLALQRIALQPLPEASIAWRTWLQSAREETRQEWLLRALNSSSESIRELVAEELEGIEIPDLDYRPDQPPSMRIRAQQALKNWFDAQT